MKGQRMKCILLLMSFGCIRATSAPYYCSYIDKDGYFECDYSKMSDVIYRPIDFDQFDPVPQRLKVMVNGYFPYYNDTRVFSEGFANISVSDFDSNYPASLVIDCGWYGSIFFEAGAFANMSYIQHLTIKNCFTYNIPAGTFSDLVNLDYLSFEGGAIDWVDPDATTGSNLEKLDYESHKFPQTLGHFETRNCDFNVKYVPPGLLFNWKNLTSVAFRNTALNTISADTFRYTTKVRYIDLSDNQFTSLPSGLFDGLDSLAEVHLYNIDWFCSCGDLWWYEYAKDNNITIFGDQMCETPSGVNVGQFWAENCIEVDYCGGQTGMAWVTQKTCVTMFDFLRYGFSLVAFILMVPILAFMIHFKRQAQAAGGTRPRVNRQTSLGLTKLKTPRKSDEVSEYGGKTSRSDGKRKERKSNKSDEVMELNEKEDRRRERKGKRKDKVGALEYI